MIGSIDSTKHEVHIVGGGIAGLLSAYFLTRQGFKVSVYEQNQHFGGLIQTHQLNYGICEAAANSFLTSPALIKLCHDLEIPLEYVPSNRRNKYILRQGRPRRFPLYIHEFMSLCLRGLFIPAKPSSQLSVRAWAQRHLGSAAYEYLINPMITGIYGCDPDDLLFELSLGKRLSTPKGWPLIPYLVKQRLLTPCRRSQPAQIAAPRDGMGTLIQRLVQRLEQYPNASLYRNHRITSLKDLPDGANIVLSLPAYQTALLWQKTHPQLSEAFSKIRYVPLISMGIILERDLMTSLKPGVGLLVPNREKTDAILGILYSSFSFNHRVKNCQKHVLLTVILGGDRHPKCLQWSNTLVLDEISLFLKKIFQYKGPIIEAKIHRYKHAIPVYNKDLKKALDLAQNLWCHTPGHLLFGNYTGAVSIREMIEVATQSWSQISPNNHNMGFTL